MIPLKDNIPTEGVPVLTIALIAINVLMFLFFQDPELSLKSSIAKLFATEAAQRIVDQALQIHGGNGVVAGHIMERLYRDVRALRIYEGSSEIQKIVIAKKLMHKERPDGL